MSAVRVKKTPRQMIDEARTFIQEGGVPNTIVATNKKTRYSIFDNLPFLVCYAGCPLNTKCYDVKILKLRPNVFAGRAKRHFFMMLRPDAYVEHLIAELTMIKMKKSLGKVRLYGGGDYTPSQLPMIIKVLKAFPKTTFYMISKEIRRYREDALQLLQFPNFFLNLSEANGIRFDLNWHEIKKHPQVNTVYTLMPDETDFAQALEADIVFNVSKAKKNIAKYLGENLVLCPCDAKTIPSKDACNDCAGCAKKGGVRKVYA